MTIYVIDRANGQFYLVEGTKLMALNLYGFLDEQDWPDTPNIHRPPFHQKGHKVHRLLLLELRTFNLGLNQEKAKPLEI